MSLQRDISHLSHISIEKWLIGKIVRSAVSSSRSQDVSNWLSSKIDDVQDSTAFDELDIVQQNSKRIPFTDSLLDPVSDIKCFGFAALDKIFDYHHRFVPLTHRIPFLGSNI